MKFKTLSLAAVVAATLSIWSSTPASAATTKTILVTSAAGGNVPGSLTAAIYQANYQGAEINYINFNIPNVQGEIEITLTEMLYIARPMIINAATQPGYSGQPLIRINCNGLASGFTVVAPGGGLPGGAGSKIEGFRIFNYSSNAITLFKGADGNVIANNHIGFAPLPVPGLYFRNTTVAPLCRGIGIESHANIIRGNTISGVHNAITLGFDIASQTSSTCTKNVIENNFIGTDPTGTSKIGNDSDGVFLAAGCRDNLVGPGNVISGNDSAGVELLSATATDNRIFGNTIGLNAARTDVIPNGELGVLIANGASNNWVGGGDGDPKAANVISGNGLGGVAIGTDEWPGPDGSNNNHVEGNLIGTDGSETRALGMQISGVTVQSQSKGNIIRRNVIVGQAHHGVVFSNASHNAMYGNWIGVTSKGAVIGNGSFGAYLFNASHNVVQPAPADAGPGKEQNIFGLNGLGVFGLNGLSNDNVIDLTSPPPLPTPTPTATPGATPGPTLPGARLLNISTRMRVETDDNALIAGFIITGDAPKNVIIRGLGPSLGIDGQLADTTLELHRPEGAIFNDDWRSTQEEAISGTGVPPQNQAESAIVATLQPGGYTAVMRGKGNTTGVGLIEVYDLDSSGASTLANISTRGIVRTGDNVMIAGFMLGGAAAEGRVVIRALGPSLTAAGISNPLGDPTVALVDSNGTQVRQSDDWQEDGDQAAQLTSFGVAPAHGRESAMVTTLPPGAYTAVVADKNGNSGTGLVEVYNVP